MARGIVLSFVVLLAVFEFGSAIRCYQCNSAQHPDCKDSGADKFVRDCTYQDSFNYNRLYLSSVLPSDMIMRTGPTAFCFKVVDEKGLTARTCMQGNSVAEANQQCANLVSNKRLQACSFCDSELCNGASSITASLPVALLTLVASYFVFRQ
ncbi:hypothetical protein NE865_09266 [Phthorimaea operculella]|nr:hypothetical protein NE865_09266 [Phthorimaea operculella]